MPGSGRCDVDHGLPVVFPVHPRTAKTLRDVAGAPETILLVEPQPYLEFNYLVRYAKAVITDSSGITEETTVKRIGTSRSQLDRLLDPDNASVTLVTLTKAAAAIGKRLKIAFEDDSSQVGATTKAA